MEICSEAACDYRYLLSRGYRPASALEFVGNHFQLRREERDFLFRAVCSPERAFQRRAKTVKPDEIRGSRLIIDGYNCLITIESALKGRPVVLSDDGFIRDIARIFRKFRATDQTRQAWHLMSGQIRLLSPARTFVFLDRQMKASGELAARIRRWMAGAGIEGTCRTVRCGEKRIASLKGIVASADSVIIDNADRVFDIAGHIIMNVQGVVPLSLPVDERHGVS